MKISRFAPLLLLCTLLSSSALAFFEDKFEAESIKETDAVKLARDTVTGGYELMTVTELKKMIDAGMPMVLIDTMPYEASYKKEHLPGAKNFLFPVPRMNTWDSSETAGKTVEDFANILGADKTIPIIVYCGFVNCTRSDNGALWARKLGYTRVYRVPGGLFAWKGSKFPLENSREIATNADSVRKCANEC